MWDSFTDSYSCNCNKTHYMNWECGTKIIHEQHLISGVIDDLHTTANKLLWQCLDKWKRDA